jgi:hypothetical protein
MRIPTRAAPIAGDTSIIIESMISNIPTPMLNPLAQPRLSLSPTPCATLDMPSNSNANQEYRSPYRECDSYSRQYNYQYSKPYGW